MVEPCISLILIKENKVYKQIRKYLGHRDSLSTVKLCTLHDFMVAISWFHDFIITCPLMSQSFGPYYDQVWLLVDLENWKLYHKCWSRDLM